MNAKGVVLVVDDTPESLMLLTDILRAEGFDVRPADSGRTGAGGNRGDSS